MSKSQTTHLSDRLEQEIQELSFRIGQRTTKLFASRQLWCAEAVFSVLNQVLKGGLSPTMAIRLSSGFPEGVGGSGCACGSLTGAVMALGLFLGRDQTGFNNNKNVRAAAKQLHTFFKTQFGATCCRVLSKDYKRGSPSHWAHCADRAGLTAQTASGLILHRRPQLLERADLAFLDQRETKLKTRLKQTFNTIGTVIGHSKHKSTP